MDEDFHAEQGFLTSPFAAMLQPDRAVLEAGSTCSRRRGTRAQGLLIAWPRPHPVRGARSAFSAGRQSTRCLTRARRVFGQPCRVKAARASTEAHKRALRPLDGWRADPRHGRLRSPERPPGAANRKKRSSFRLRRGSAARGPRRRDDVRIARLGRRLLDSWVHLFRMDDAVRLVQLFAQAWRRSRLGVRGGLGRTRVEGRGRIRRRAGRLGVSRAADEDYAGDQGTKS